MKLKSYLRGLGVGLFISAVLMGIATSGKKETLSDDEIRTRAKALGMVEEDSVLKKPEAEAANTTEATIKIEPEEDKPDTSKDGPENAKIDPDPEEETKEETAVEDTYEEDAAGKDKAGNDSDSIRGSKEDRAMGGQSQTDDSKEEDKAKENTEEKTEDKAEDKTGDSSEDQTEQKKDPTQKVSGLQNSSDKLGYNEFFTLQIAQGASSETVAQLLKKGGAIEDAGDFDDFLCNNNYDKKIHPGVFKIPIGADYDKIAAIITGK